tara:strand:- start:259 stop:546 length:288 start_codon:yes stop_codon:yes gene_type:complete
LLPITASLASGVRVNTRANAEISQGKWRRVKIDPTKSIKGSWSSGELVEAKQSSAANGITVIRSGWILNQLTISLFEKLDMVKILSARETARLAR